MTSALQGRTIALAETRQLEELAGLLEREGARTLRYPLVSILDAPDAAPVAAWLRELIDGRFALLVLMTGEALRRLHGFAEREGMGDAFVTALGQARTLCRGPKPVQALRELGLASTLAAKAPTTEGVIATLREQPLQGKTIGYTLYGEPNPALEDFLRGAGATPRPVLPYVYAPRSDDERVADLIVLLERGEIDVLCLTSSSQVDRLYEVAGQRQLEEALQRGWQHTRVAAVGPVLAEHLREKGAPVHICPEQGFVMKNLVRTIARQLGEQ